MFLAFTGFKLLDEDVSIAGVGDSMSLSSAPASSPVIAKGWSMLSPAVVVVDLLPPPDVLADDDTPAGAELF